MKLNKRSEKWLKKLEGTSLKLETSQLINGESVEIGYRSSCGCKDQTLKDFEIFNNLLKALKSQGVTIEQNLVEHKNAYASNNGGFWNSYIFKIK